MTRVPRPAEHVQSAKSAGEAGGRAGSVESLYPFLYQSTIDPAKVFAQALQSTLAKTREIIDLRVEVCARTSNLLASCAADMAARFLAGGRLLSFGNGGSATDAADLTTLFLYPPGGVLSLPALDLASDVSVLTALANDIGVEVIFARQLAALGKPADIALGLSTSGNSENLLRAFDEARQAGMLTVGLSGYDGGKMAEIASLDYLFVAPSASIHRIQEAQTTIYHILWELVVAELDRGPVIT
ncbi:MAG TPA: SIS domain-containing protein [Streptosporangiaceae bacterium]|nr:SIS domain-containing protein [Streptosporangiaceae bacterium]